MVEKLGAKHSLTSEEVEEAIANRPRFMWAERGNHPGEDLYVAYGRTNAGRYIVVFFIYKANEGALVVSARDMTERERRRYGRK